MWLIMIAQAAIPFVIVGLLVALVVGYSRRRAVTADGLTHLPA